MTTSPAIISPDRLRRGFAALPWLIAAAMLAYAFIAGGYFVTVMSFAMIYAVFVIGLNVFMGTAGQVTFGHNAFAALSGYASAVLTATYGWEPIAAVRGGDSSRAVRGARGRMADAQAQGSLSRHGDLGDRADRVRGRDPVAVGDARLHGDFRHPAARHRRPRDRFRPRQAHNACRHRGAVEPGRRAVARFALRPGAVRHRRQRRRRARARHRRRALQACSRSWSRPPMRRSPARCSCMWWNLSVPKCSGCTWSFSPSPCCMSAASARSAAQFSAP